MSLYKMITPLERDLSDLLNELQCIIVFFGHDFVSGG